MTTSFNPMIVWAILGIILIIIEVLTTQFVLLFFGIAALIVSGLQFFTTLSFTSEIILFGCLGLAGVLLLRKKCLDTLKAQGHKVDPDSAPFILTQTIPAEGSARIEYQGTFWTAQNPSSKVLNVGDRVEVVRTEGIQLILKKV